MRRVAPLLMYTGVVAIVFGLGHYHGRYIGGYDFTGSFRFAWAITYVFLLCLAAYGLGLPDLGRAGRGRLAGAVAAAGVGSLLMSAVQLFVGDALLPRFVVFGAALAVVPLFVATSVMSSAGRLSLEARDRVFVVGPPSLEAMLGAELADNPERPAALVGALMVEAAVGDRTTDDRPLLDAAVACRATVLVLNPEASLDERIVDQAAELHERGVRVRTQSLFYEEWLAKLPVSELGRVSLFFDIGEVHRERYSRFKRIIDVAAGIVGLAVLATLIPLVVVGNAIGNRGPLFFIQDRVGRGGQPFRIVKFRTMRRSETAVWTTSDDPRITSFGRYLRIAHVDEVPQVWNILRGDLSLVGPRPEQPVYVEHLKRKLPFYDLRHIVRPGLTGWAQVKYGYAGDERDALEKLQYDFHYLRRQSLLFDLQIVGRTVRSVVGGQGRGR